MKLQLLYQKVYFKSNEWKELVNSIRSFDQNISIFLLSKNIFLDELKQVKSKFLGECVIVEFSFNDINVVFELINKIQKQYGSKFFLIGFLFNQNNKIYFLKIDQFKYYLSFYNDKKKKALLTNNFHTLILYELLKFLKLNEINKNVCLSFFKNNLFNNSFNYYI
jgi:hypothetical protein